MPLAEPAAKVILILALALLLLTEIEKKQSNKPQRELLKELKPYNTAAQEETPQKELHPLQNSAPARLLEEALQDNTPK